MAEREQLLITELVTPTGAVIDFGTAAPTTGTHKLGAIRFNTAPAAAGVIGWTCTAAGTPGTWKTFGTIES